MTVLPPQYFLKRASIENIFTYFYTKKYNLATVFRFNLK